MMEMMNLEQIRAKNAIVHLNEVFGGKDGGEVAKKIPTMIRDNGFLAALAFAIEQGEDSGYNKVFLYILIHLKSLGRFNIPESYKTADEFMRWLLNGNSRLLRDVTTESLLYMNYLRRFAN